jgi:putative sterol carrier protein
MNDVDTGQLDPAEAARGISQATDEQLEQLMGSEMRRQILSEIFGRMEQHFRAESARDTDAVIRWRIKGGPDGSVDEWETVIAEGTCAVREGFQAEEARVTFSIGGADFLKLVTGNAAGPVLFMRGKLKISGDMMFAASAAGLFTIPKG